MLERIVRAVKNELPRFNDDLIIAHREHEFENLVKFIAERLEECAYFTDPNLILTSYYIIPPKERLIEELDNGIKKNIIDINANESVLVRYNFVYHEHSFDVTLYVPYLFENSSVIANGTNYECLLSMTEKLFSIRSKSHGLTIKVVRSPIACWMNTIHPYIDEASGQQFVGNIISCKIHLKKMAKSKKVKPTIFHYLLCKFTIPELLVKLGIDHDAAYFVEKEEFDDKFYYFKTRGHASNRSSIFLKVNKELMHTHTVLHDMVSTILYFMSSQRFVMFDELIVDSKRIFITILGKLIYSNSTNRIHALNYMLKHIESTDSYLDAYTKSIFADNGIIVNDIYDLFCFVIENMNWILMNFPNNDMYNKRLEIINHIITDNLIRQLNLRIYKFEKKADPMVMFKASKKAFRVPPQSILRALRNTDSVRIRPSVNGDNWLLSIGCKCVKRLSASVKSASSKKGGGHGGSGINAPVNKFHSSMLNIESAIGFSSKPGTNCLINPYATIDVNGGFVRDEYSDETAAIAKKMVNGSTI